MALEALVRFSDEELKHQALFRRIERMMGDIMPDGYRFVPEADDVAKTILKGSDWAVLALTLGLELLTQLHYRQSIDPDDELSELFKDVFLHHWKEECQHAILDELEWLRHDGRVSSVERDRGVGEFIELVATLDDVLQAQVAADASYFAATRRRPVDQEERRAIEAGFLDAYRWQFIHSGAQHPHFQKVLSSLINTQQDRRIQMALSSLH